MSDPFKIRAHVPAFEAVSAEYGHMSDAARASIACVADLPYGDDPAARIDLFMPSDPRNAPVHLFIHGGYWRANRKEDYAFVAGPVVAAGAIAAIVEYPLMPAARLSALVAHVRLAAVWLAGNVGRYGGNPAQISASGHSAGAHLASYLVARGPHEDGVSLPAIKSLLLVSGIYDVAPITTSFLQAEIGLTPDEVTQWTPLSASQAGNAAVTLAVGGAETVPFLMQAGAFEKRLVAGGWPAARLVLPGEDHMTIVRELGRPGSAMSDLLQATIAQSTV